MIKLKLLICCLGALIPLINYSAVYLPGVETSVQASGGPVAILKDGSLPGLSISTVQEAGDKKVDYKRDIQPLLKASCYACHTGEKPQAELRLDTKAGAMKGGVSGPAIMAGNSKASLLMQRVHGEGGGVMPPVGKLAKEQIALLAAWIDEGAEWPAETAALEKTSPEGQPQLAGNLPASGQGIDFV